MTSEKLLELQLMDSHIDLLGNRMPKLPEVIASNGADAEVSAWERTQSQIQARIIEFEAAITLSEHANAAIGAKRGRLEQQLKTVIAPREAEALMHEIALLNAQRSDLDDQELASMDSLADAEAAMAENRTKEPIIRGAAAVAAEKAAAARAECEADIAATTITRDALRADFDAATISRYDSMRAAHNGIAVAKLNGLRCDGCHLDLSRGEVDEMKRQPADELIECSNCGRLLVR